MPKLLLIAAEFASLIPLVRAIIKAAKRGDAQEAKRQADALRVEAERLARLKAAGQ